MEFKKFPESIEGMVKFDELDACALVHGFSKNRFAIKQLKDVAGIEKLKTFAYTLLRTSGMKFRPSQDMKIIYSQIAEIELKRLTGGVLVFTVPTPRSNTSKPLKKCYQN